MEQHRADEALAKAGTIFVYSIGTTRHCNGRIATLKLLIRRFFTFGVAEPQPSYARGSYVTGHTRETGSSGGAYTICSPTPISAIVLASVG